MGKKRSYAQQFKPGTYPDQHWDESTRVNGHDQDAPSKVRKRQGVARDSQVEANPGLAAQSDYSRKRRK